MCENLRSRKTLVPITYLSFKGYAQTLATKSEDAPNIHNKKVLWSQYKLFNTTCFRRINYVLSWLKCWAVNLLRIPKNSYNLCLRARCSQHDILKIKFKMKPLFLNCNRARALIASGRKKALGSILRSCCLCLSYSPSAPTFPKPSRAFHSHCVWVSNQTRAKDRLKERLRRRLQELNHWNLKATMWLVSFWEWNVRLG